MLVPWGVASADGDDLQASHESRQNSGWILSKGQDEREDQEKGQGQLVGGFVTHD
ncbi:MAG: hypothetical protein OIN85_01170 [Candidatus Methanoperedens sp.]|nr:hypothetical protein [Candidatus Methanoperedens sp.]